MNLSDDRSTKWHQRKFCQLKALHAKRNSNDGDTKEYADTGSLYRQRNTAKNQPENITEHRANATAKLYFFPKRKKGKPCKFKALHTYKDPDDGDAPEHAHQEPA